MSLVALSWAGQGHLSGGATFPWMRAAGFRLRHACASLPGELVECRVRSGLGPASWVLSLRFQRAQHGGY